MTLHQTQSPAKKHVSIPIDRGDQPIQRRKNAALTGTRPGAFELTSTGTGMLRPRSAWRMNARWSTIFRALLTRRAPVVIRGGQSAPFCRANPRSTRCAWRRHKSGISRTENDAGSLVRMHPSRAFHVKHSKLRRCRQTSDRDTDKSPCPSSRSQGSPAGVISALPLHKLDACFPASYKRMCNPHSHSAVRLPRSANLADAN